MFGFLNIYKPQGKTSHDVVAILRRLTKIKQIGHTGTLDPFAEGVLPICIGKATRLIEYLEDDKAYIGVIQFGKSTTTYDIEGEVVNSSDKKISSKNIEQILPLYRGEIMQTPPIYSAIKVKGKKLYEYAREGKDVNIEARKVNIYKLELIEFNEEEQIAKVLIECSKGTYIRSIAHDLGTDLGCFGHLINLIRVKAGRFNISDSIKLEELSDMDKIREKIINPLEFLNYSHYDLNEEEKEKVSHGMNLKINKEDGIVILTYKNELISVAEIHDKNAKMKKVFI